MSDEEKPICPRCGKERIIKKNPKGAFYLGCPDPACVSSQPIHKRKNGAADPAKASAKPAKASAPKTHEITRKPPAKSHWLDDFL